MMEMMIRTLCMIIALGGGSTPEQAAASPPHEIISEEGVNLSWPMAGMAVAGLAYIIRAELQGRTNARNITALWEQVNRLRNNRQ